MTSSYFVKQIQFVPHNFSLYLSINSPNHSQTLFFNYISVELPDEGVVDHTIVI